MSEEVSNRILEQVKAQEWLYEMELYNNPVLINNLKMNILATSPFIKDAELLFYFDGKQLLVWLDFYWYYPSYFRKQLLGQVSEIIRQLLPNFSNRVVFDKNILNAAMEKLQKAGITTL